MTGTSAESLEALRGVDLFEGFDDEELRLLGGFLRKRRASTDERVVEEGDVDRALYVVSGGRVRIVGQGVELGTLGPGEHFGEIALFAGRKRTATVVAAEPTTLHVLEEDAFESFTEAHAGLAIRFMRRMVATTSDRLSRMNESIGTLLRARELPRRIDVTVRLGEREEVHRSGTLASEVLPQRVGDAPVVAAIVDGRARPLDTPLTGSCSLTPLTTAHWEGQRIYRRSLALALLEAGEQLGLALRMGASLGFAQRVLIENGARIDETTAGALEAALRKLVEADVPLVRERLSVVEAVDYLERVGWSDAAQLVETTTGRTVVLASYGDLFVPESGPMLPSTGPLCIFSVLRDGDDLLLVYSVPGHTRAAPRETMDRERAARLSGAPPVDIALEARDVSRQSVQMTGQQERWLTTLGLGSVGDFNRRCIEGNVGELINVAESFQEKSIGRIADALAERSDEVKIVCIAGPSSSGKTTFIRRLRVQLQVNGIHPIPLGLDDYYVDRERTPRDAEGDFDFEALEALRLDLLTDHLSRLAMGHEVQTARYDFPSGVSATNGGPRLQLRDNDLLMLEGIHGLNPRLYDRLPAKQLFRIFVCPLVQLPFDRLERIHASDVRLLRRIVRDRYGRALSAADTIMRWPKVRAGERKHIYPFQNNAHEVFDTSLVYEISVLRVFAERYLLEVPTHHEAQATAERLLGMLSEFVSIYPQHVPPTSLLREFIGGSSFER